MKINLFALGRAVRALIITVIGFSFIGILVYPELVKYSPENPELLAAQRDFALASIIIGIFAGGLFYWESTRK